MSEVHPLVSELSVIQSSTLGQLVQRELERQILSGALRAGERINEVEIARALGVSRGPVREALRTLREMGLVKIRKNYGVTVRKISAQDAADIYEIRAVLESLACRRAVSTIDDKQIAEIHTLVERMEQAAASSDVDSYHLLNIRFHERLLELANSFELIGVYQILLKKLTLFRRRTLGQDGAISVSNAEHRVILRELVTRNADAAAQAMHDHIMASSRRMQKGLRLFLENHEDSEPGGNENSKNESTGRQ